jgi:hypothetical protein
MRHHKTISILLFIALIAVPFAAHAQLSMTRRPIGGRVTSTPAQLNATIVCAATYGPFFMLPFNVATPGPFFIRATTRGMPRLNGYLLGLYNLTPDLSTCYNPETGVPVPAFEIQPYGVNR